MLFNILLAVLTIFSLLFGFIYYQKYRQLNLNLKKRESETHRRMYELSILKELGDRIGYSLNVQNIVDVITGSLSQFINYKAVSYMLLGPEKVIFKIHLEQSVSRRFVDDVRGRMLNSLSALTDKEFTVNHVEEILSGAILVPELEEPVSSFFNIPLVIANRVVGVLTVAHTSPGLYKEEEMTILYKITQQASQAVTRLQEVVETEQRKLNAMVESMAEGVVMTDTDYRILVVNPAAKQAVGLSDKKDLSIFDFIDNLGGKFDIRGRLEESVKLDKVLFSEEVPIKDHFFKIIVSPVKATGIMEGKILGGVVLFRDITHEKEIEKMKEDFTSMIAHELRSPLNGIKKITEMMRLVKVKAAEKTEYINLIYKSSTELLDLVNNLLDAAKLESGKFEILKQPSDIRKIIKERVTFFKSTAESAKIMISWESQEDVPTSFNFDSFRISQVLNNLISNALKFTNAGGEIKIHSFLHKAGVKNKLYPIDGSVLANLPDSVAVMVTDSGSGIPKDKINLLFGKFRQLSTEQSGEKRGTGLGLAISKGIVEAHNGVIGVSSEEGRGSVFYFTIPIDKT